MTALSVQAGKQRICFTLLILVLIVILFRWRTNLKSFSMEYLIERQWDGQPTGHAAVKVRLTHAAEGVLVNIEAPFFNDPPNPGGKPGQPFQQLWDYEVVEVFFLNEKQQYLEVEFSPHGQHIVLLLNGPRKMFLDMLPLTYSATISGGSWKGEAIIPASYFPLRVSKFNAYAIHGSGEKRMYEALYPAPTGKHDQPDFHRLEYFKPMQFVELLPSNPTDDTSELWQKSHSLT